MNKNFHYKPKNYDRKHQSRYVKRRRSLIRAFKKKMRRLFKMITPEDMEE